MPAFTTLAANVQPSTGITTGDPSPLAGVYARIGALEAEVRRLAQENTQLRDELRQDATRHRSDVMALRKEVKYSKKDQGKIQDNATRESGRVWDMSKDVWEIKRTAAELNGRVTYMERYK